MSFGEQPPQEYGFDTSSKTDDAVELDDRHPFVMRRAQGRIGVDVYQLRRESVRPKQLGRVVAQMATGSGIQHDAFRTISAHGPHNRKVCEKSVCFM